MESTRTPIGVMDQNRVGPACSGLQTTEGPHHGDHSHSDAESIPDAGPGPCAQTAGRTAPGAADAATTTSCEQAMTPDEWNYLWNRRFDLRLRVLMNQLYQQDRQRLFELREGGVKVCSLLAGSAVISRLADPQVITVAAAVIFISTATSLVFGWGAKARDAAKRSAEWSALHRDIDAAGERQFTERQLDSWFGRCNELEAGEPAANQVLLERCYRRAVEALGGDDLLVVAIHA